MLAGGLAPGGGRATPCVRTGADVVHAHNIHPLFGARALAAARAAGAGSSCTSTTTAWSARSRSTTATARSARAAAGATPARRAPALPRQPARGGRLRGRARAPAARAISRRSDRFVAPSAFAARRLAELGLHGYRIAVAAQLPAPRASSRPRRRRRGRVRAVRRPPGRGEGRRHRDRGGGARRRAAGDRRDRARRGALRALARRRCAGHVPRAARAGARCARRCGSAAFALAPSRWDEPCPYSVIEAMAAGLPVLASERGGLPEMVGEERVLPGARRRGVGGGDARAVGRRRAARAGAAARRSRAPASCSARSASTVR